MLPIFNIFELGIKEGKKNAYVAVGKNNITKSVLNDKGTLGMYLVQEKENPNMTYMFEVYEDEKSYQKHIKPEQYKEFLRQSPTILTNHKKKIQVMPEYMGDKKFVQTRNTRVNYVTVDVKERFNDTFREIVLDEMKQSKKKEEGVYVIYAATAKENPDKWYFFEIYENEKAYQKHRKTAHFKKYIEQTENIIENKEFINIEGVILLNKGNLNYVK